MANQFNDTVKYHPMTLDQMHAFVDVCTDAGFKYLPYEDHYGIEGEEYTQHYVKGKITLKVTLKDTFWTVSFDD